MRLWLRDELRKIDGFLIDFLKVITARAEQEIDYIMPGYTHLQRAQPIRWRHWLLSYGMAFQSDLDRLREVIARVNLSPLGCGALVSLFHDNRLSTIDWRWWYWSYYRPETLSTLTGSRWLRSLDLRDYWWIPWQRWAQETSSLRLCNGGRWWWHICRDGRRILLSTGLPHSPSHIKHILTEA